MFSLNSVNVDITVYYNKNKHYYYKQTGQQEQLSALETNSDLLRAFRTQLSKIEQKII